MGVFFPVILSILFSQIAIANEELSMAMGLSRLLRFNFKVGKVVQKPILTEAIVVRSSESDQRVHLIPILAGKAEVAILDDQGTTRATYHLGVEQEKRDRVVEQMIRDDRERGVEPIRMTLILGIQRVLTTPTEILSIYLTDPWLLDYRRIKEGDGPDRKLIFIPKKEGLTDLLVHDGKGLPRTRYYLEVVEKGNALAIRKQRDEEEKEGLVTREIEISLGRTIPLPLGFEIGPIYLCDPSILDYRRREKDIVITPKNPGTTDLLFHDANGKARIKYYVTVKP